jgi:beta-galactosidase/beta-glucuronidase
MIPQYSPLPLQLTKNADDPTLLPGDSQDVQLCATVSRPELWYFDHPHLYRWAASLQTSEGQLLHTEEVRFGVLAIELRHAQLHLNGEPVPLVGLTVMQIPLNAAWRKRLG